MKLVIVSMLLLVGDQICSANDQSQSFPCCTSELKELNANAYVHIEIWKKQQNRNHDIVLTIKNSLAESLDKEYIFLEGRYASTVDEALCAVKSFIDNELSIINQRMEISAKFIAACDNLNDKNIDFTQCNDLCYRLVLLPNKYERDLIATRSYISTFIKAMVKHHDVVVPKIHKFVAAEQDIVKLMNRFRVNISKNFGCEPIDFCQLKTTIHEFFVKLNVLQWVTVNIFSEVHNIGDQVTRRSGDFLLRQSCV